MQNTVFSEKFGSQMSWRQARGLHGMLFYRSRFALTRRLKEFRFLTNSTAGLCTSDCGRTRQVCRAGGSPHSLWVQDRWKGRQLLRDLLQPGSSSIHFSPSCKSLTVSKHFKKSLPSPFPKKVQIYFLCCLWALTQEGLIVITCSESPKSLLVELLWVWPTF